MSDDPAAKVSGRYWHQQQQQTAPRHVEDIAYQNQLFDRLAALTCVALDA